MRITGRCSVGVASRTAQQLFSWDMQVFACLGVAIAAGSYGRLKWHDSPAARPQQDGEPNYSICPLGNLVFSRGCAVCPGALRCKIYTLASRPAWRTGGSRLDSNQQPLQLLVLAGSAESTKTNEKHRARRQEDDEQNRKNCHDLIPFRALLPTSTQTSQWTISRVRIP
jgi:hypothetical protein